MYRMWHNEEDFFSVHGIVTLCEAGLMVNGTTPDLKESDRVMFAITDSVREEFMERFESGPGEKTPDELQRLETELQHNWGLLEFLETNLHSKLLKLERHQERAYELNIPNNVIKTYDFACLWESQIQDTGRVLFFTDDKATCQFGAEVVASCKHGRSVPIIHMDDLNRAWSAHGGPK